MQIDLADQLRSGRLREIYRELSIKAINEDTTLPTGDLADDFQCSDEQIRKILENPFKKWRKGILIPHDLT
ncbi:hypothetical protein KIN20_030186 [Parelaphostrongylus tenuis]|uniref:Uncharacterized protein n=1 Tax=Parelaphostrongylus tenuis TaxID=148309 RepID=A0AAD5R3I4_PARTN|nr:hypothetical protein KIN20_030186 [Parelaphostrongylus tenuis]